MAHGPGQNIAREAREMEECRGTKNDFYSAELAATKSNRFIVYHPLFPSYAIKSWSITSDCLSLTMWMVHDMKLSDVLKHLWADKITIGLLNPEGVIVDEIVAIDCKVVDVSSRMDWSKDEYMEAHILYNYTLDRPTVTV